MAFKERPAYRQMEVFGALRDEKRATFFAEKVPGSPSYSFNQKSGRAKGLYYVKWDDVNQNLPQAINDFLGYSEQQAFGSIKCISRHTPYQHPNFQGALYAESIEQIEGDTPIGSPSQDMWVTALYDEALFSVTFANREYQVLTDRELHNATGNNNILDESSLLRYVTVAQNPAGRSERIPGVQGALKWFGEPFAAGGAKMPASVTTVFDLVMADVLITWHQVPFEMIPWTAIRNCVGKTNAQVLGLAPFYPYFPDETLVLLLPKIPPPYMMPNGFRAVDIMYPMRYHPYGALKAMRWDAIKDDGGAPSLGPTYQTLTRDGLLTGLGMYRTADFDSLFFGEP